MGHRVTGRRTGYCSSQGAGWEFVHVAIDDHSRIACADIFPDQKKESAVAFLVATIGNFRSLGITVERVMTDNGSCYLSKASLALANSSLSSTSGLSLTLRKPTAKPNASSRPR